MKILIGPTLIFLSFFYGSFLFPTAIDSKSIPELKNRVTLESVPISAEVASRWEGILADHELRTTNQVAIFVIDSLEGEVLEEYSLKVAEKWKLGTKKKDNGVLILLSIRDRKVRIEVGYGLEGILTDVYCNRVIKNSMIPWFKEENYESGITEGLTEILTTLETGETPIEPTLWEQFKEFRGVAGDGSINIIVGYLLSFLFVGMIFMFAFIFSFHRDDTNIWPFFFLLIFFQWLPTMFLGYYGWMICNIIYIIGFPFIRLTRNRISWVSKISDSVTDNVHYSTGGGSSSGSGGGSSGGFSGGGGSFGGGGSSGSW